MVIQPRFKVPLPRQTRNVTTPFLSLCFKVLNSSCQSTVPHRIFFCKKLQPKHSYILDERLPKSKPQCGDQSSNDFIKKMVGHSAGNSEPLQSHRTPKHHSIQNCLSVHYRNPWPDTHDQYVIKLMSYMRERAQKKKCWN